MEEKVIVSLKFYNELKEMKENLDKNKLIFCKGGRHNYYEYIYYNADDYCKELIIKNENLENELNQTKLKWNILIDEFYKISKIKEVEKIEVEKIEVKKIEVKNKPWYKQIFN